MHQTSLNSWKEYKRRHLLADKKRNQMYSRSRFYSSSKCQRAFTKHNQGILRSGMSWKQQNSQTLEWDWFFFFFFSFYWPFSISWIFSMQKEYIHSSEALWMTNYVFCSLLSLKLTNFWHYFTVTWKAKVDPSLFRNVSVPVYYLRPNNSYISYSNSITRKLVDEKSEKS